MCKTLTRSYRGLLTALAAGGLAMSVAACDISDTQNVATAVDAACIALPIGTQIAVQIASSVGGVSIPATVGGQITQDVASTCASVTAGVQAVIERITASGGTATVTVNTQTPRGVKRRHMLVIRPSP